MLSRSDTQKIQSLTNKPRLSQLPGKVSSVHSSRFTVFYLNTSLRWIRCVLCRPTESFAVCKTAAALKHNVYDDGGLYRL